MIIHPAALYPFWQAVPALQLFFATTLPHSIPCGPLKNLLTPWIKVRPEFLFAFQYATAACHASSTNMFLHLSAGFLVVSEKKGEEQSLACQAGMPLSSGIWENPGGAADPVAQYFVVNVPDVARLIPAI
jgi:hypothetical protein